MSLSAGTRLGPYEIHSLIGAGGMGEVYKARDTRLDRTVAVKLLPADLAERPDRRRRFEAEARAISALNHPHICTLFDVGEQDGRAFLVMEHLEGETLDDRLVRGALPAADVVRYAIQIAGALDHAHRERIVHRDLKPSNVMVTASGTKLLDFGLARRPALEPIGPTMSTLSFDQRKLTAEGTILGTFQYMAPEQLEGKEADARTDIFAFGTLIFEMATGRKAFEGKSQASLIASILTAHPPAISTTQRAKGLPPALDHVVERCLAKNPDDRWQTARDVKLELEWIAGGSSEASRAAAPARHGRRARLAWGLAGIAIAAAFGARLSVRESPPTDVTRFVVAPPAGTIIPVAENRTLLALSPDGRQLAFVAVTDGRQQVWVRPFESATARPLDGTDDAISPFWSPDSRFIGFFAPATGELKKIEASGGPARTICAAPQLEGAATWGRDGTILLTQLGQGIFRVSAVGGTPQRVTELDKTRRERNHFWPEFLPDGRHFLYMATSLDAKGVRETPTVYVASFDSPTRKPLAQMHSKMVYAAPGYVLFVQDGALLAQTFDASALELRGEPARIVEGVAYYRTIGTAEFTVSSNGVLAYQGAGDAFYLVWHDQRGNATDSGWAPQGYAAMRISPDGQRLAVGVVDPRIGTGDIWIYDVSRSAIRFTTDLAHEDTPVWSPDGSRILFRSERSGAPSLFIKAFDGAEEQVFPGASPLSAQPMSPTDWSADGRWIAYVSNSPQTVRDLWLVPLAGDRKPLPLAATRFDEFDAQFSPDSAWVAFVSSESGTPEVFVAPVRQPGDKRPISVGGGTTPRWRKDGRELYYASSGNRSIMAVPIQQGSAITAGVPRRLFSLGIELATRPNPRNTVYDVTPDGQRFLVSVPAGEPVSSRITVVQNWNAALKKP